jgi:fatty-acyl-CoA synthase
METLWQLLDDAASRFGDRTALAARRGFRTERWSYRRLREFAVNTAACLERIGLRQGDRLLVWAPNSPEWVGLYFARGRSWWWLR